MTISMNMVPEETIEECKRHVDECAALLERTSVPEYREAIIAMAKAWKSQSELRSKQVVVSHRTEASNPDERCETRLGRGEIGPDVAMLILATLTGAVGCRRIHRS